MAFRDKKVATLNSRIDKMHMASDVLSSLQQIGQRNRQRLERYADALRMDKWNQYRIQDPTFYLRLKTENLGNMPEKEWAVVKKKREKISDKDWLKMCFEEESLMKEPLFVHFYTDLPDEEQSRFVENKIDLDDYLGIFMAEKRTKVSANEDHA